MFRKDHCVERDWKPFLTWVSSNEQSMHIEKAISTQKVEADAVYICLIVGDKLGGPVFWGFSPQLSNALLFSEVSSSSPVTILSCT